MTNSEKMNKSEIISNLWDAFLLGWGYGQGKMEEEMDNNLFDAFLQVTASNSVGGGSAPCHTVAIPNTFDISKDKNGKHKIVNIRPDFDNKYVRYKLHSDKWRKTMLSKKDEFLELVNQIIKQ